MKQACEVLHNLGDDKYRPGVVGLLVSLYVALNDQPAAARVFEETVDWYKNHQVVFTIRICEMKRLLVGLVCRRRKAMSAPCGNKLSNST